MEHQTLLIEDDRIAAVSHARATTIPGDVISVDGRGKFAIPGRWDSHTHITLYGESGLQALIESGITSIRDMGGDLSQIDSWPSEMHNRQRV